MMMIPTGVSPYTCRDALERLDDYLDRELSEAEMGRVREHLETCESCAPHFRAEEQLLRQVKDKVRRIAVPEDLMARIQRKLAEG